MTYVLPDHQDSFAHLVTSAGTNDVTESFTAYGNRRSGSTWSGPPSSNDETAINAVSRWGYTGETMLGVSMGLVDLNGRVEDAAIGRFLSADPYIPDAENAQSFNRYGYVNNNPLTYVDPSGFDGQNPGAGGTSGNQPCGAVAQDGCQNPPGLGIQQLAKIPVYGSRLPSGVSSTSITLTPVGSGSGGGVDGGGGGGDNGNNKPQRSGCTHSSGTRAEVGAALASWGQNMAKTSSALAGMGSALALGSAFVATVAPVTAPLAAAGIGTGLAGAAVGGVGSIIGGVAMWLGGAMEGNTSVAGYGFVTATVNAALTVVDVPPLPSGVTDPAELVASAAGLSPDSSIATCP